MAMSCNLRLYKLVNWALNSRSSYVEFQSQKTALSPRSFTRSSFLQSELLQKCQTNPQYIKYGNIAALYIFNFALTGINFRNLINIPTRILAFLHAVEICSSKYSCSSISTPSKISFSVILILQLSTSIFSSCEFFDMVIAWYLLKFPSRKFSMYQQKVCFPSRVIVSTAFSGSLWA